MFNEALPKYITIGLAGHVAHGKTTLAETLTAAAPLAAVKEKERRSSAEITVKTAYLPSGDSLELIDVPGHSRFLKNTIRGLSCVDAAILVVAADDGVMPQTEEHLRVLELLNVRRGFTVLSKADLVDEETLELAELEVREAVQGTFLEGKAVLISSAFDGGSMSELRDHLERQCRLGADKTLEAPFRLWIDQKWSIKGFGTVVAGTVLSGTVRRGDPLLLVPSRLETRARFLKVMGKPSDVAAAGQRVTLNLHNLPFAEVRRGMTLVQPGPLFQSRFLNVKLQTHPSSPVPIRNYQRVKLHLGTSVMNTLIIHMNRGPLQPGESGYAQLRLPCEVAALPGDPFLIAPLNVNRVIGGGAIIEVAQEKYRAVKAAGMIARLKALQHGAILDIADHLFQKKGHAPLTAAEMALCSGIPVNRIEPAVKEKIAAGEFVHLTGRGFFPKSRGQVLKTQLLEEVKKIQADKLPSKPVGMQEMKEKLPMDEAILQSILKELCRDGALIEQPGGYRLPGEGPDQPVHPDKLIDLLLEYAEQLGFAHFNADMFWKHHQQKHNKNHIQRLLEYLRRENQLIRLNNNRYLTPQAMEKIMERVRATILEKGRLTLEDSKKILGYGRTGGIPVLEYLDAIALTRRVGNERVLKE